MRNFQVLSVLKRSCICYCIICKTVYKVFFSVGGHAAAGQSIRASSQAARAVRPQQRMAGGISQSGRVAMCFRMSMMVAKANSNLASGMSNNISIKE